MGKMKMTIECPDTPGLSELPQLQSCGDHVGQIDEIKFMSREEAIARYGLLPIPCTMNGIPVEVIMIKDDGTAYGLPMEDVQVDQK